MSNEMKSTTAGTTLNSNSDGVLLGQKIADEILSTLLRAVAPPLPGVRIERHWGGDRHLRVLLAVATFGVRCRIEDVPLADVNKSLIFQDGQRLLRHRVGGVLVAALPATDGMVLSSGDQPFLIANGTLARIDWTAHYYLHDLRRAAAAKAAEKPGVRLVYSQPAPGTNAPGGAS